MKIRKLIALLATLLLVVTPMTAVMPVSVSAEMGGDFPWTDTSEKMLIEEILERDGLIDGIWFPWFNAGETGHNLTGNDLMADYYNSSTTKNWDRVELDYYGADKIYREIYNLKAMGYNMLAYGGSIMGEGVIFDANGDVTGIKTEYLTNARRLLDMCREVGMPVMWNVYFHCSSMPHYYGIDGWKVICQMLGNNTIADHYAEYFVRPLCEMLAEYPDVVALVSIADEPENEINDIGVGNHYEEQRALYGVNQEDMVYFMQQINEVVREELPGVARTVASNSGNKTIYRDFDLDLMGHNQYTDGDSFKSVESLITDADPILTEYNIGSTVAYTDEEYAEKQITYRKWMINNGYKGGFQWCWMTNSAATTGKEYFLQRDKTDPTSFRKSVSLLKYYMDEYRAEFRGETLGLVAPVLYANTGDGVVKFIPSEKATKITVQRSDDGGSTWTTLASNLTQSDYVDEYLIGTYTDTTTRPDSGYCYRIIATDGTTTVTSEPNDLAGVDATFTKTYTAPTYTRGQYVGSGSVNSYMTQLTSFGVEANRPLNEAFNLIENGSFESTGGQWNTDSFLTYASVVSDSTTPLGEKSLYFNTSNNSTAGWYTFTVTGLEANTDYTFSAFLKGAYLSDNNKGFGSIGVIDPYNSQFMVYKSYYPRGSRLTQQIYPTAWDDEWHLRAVSFNTGSRTSYTIALYGYSSQMWVDGMALFESVNGGKYENGESAKVITSSTYNPTSGATNAVTDPLVNDASYWNTGAGYKQGFMSIASGALKYTASSDPNGVRYTKWIDVKPGTDYYVSYTVKVTTAGSGRVAILDNAKLLPNENLTCSFSSTGTKTVTGRISTGKYDQLGLCVVDLGGVATIDNIYLYEAGESVEIPTDPSFDGYIINGTFEIGSSNNWENLWNSNTVNMVDGRDSLFAMKVSAGQYTHVRQFVTVEANTDYVIELWTKDVTSTALMVKDGADTTNIKNVGLPSGSTWTKTTVEFNSGENTEIIVSLMGSAAGATYTVDDIYMYKVADPSFDGYVTNGDFEAGEAGWTYNSGTHAIVTDAHGGNAALQLTNPSAWGEAAMQIFDVEPNTSYTITWWYKAASGTGTYNISVMNASGWANMTAEGGQSWMNNYTGAWTQGRYVVNTGSATQMALKFTTEATNPGTILIDDIVVTKTEDAVCTHSYTSRVTTAATCGATGVRTYTCSLCGDSYTEEIAATGAHSYDNVCDTDCNVCGTTRTAAHQYSGNCDQYCDLCGAKKTSFIIAMHTYDNDCDADCNVCGYVRTVTGHTYDNDCDVDCNTCGATREASHSYNAVVTDPTCTAQGYTTYTCGVCGDSYKGNYVAALSHSYSGVVTAPTCTAQGYTTYTCSVCGDSYKGSYVAALGHTYDNDCDADCNTCGATRTPADHKYVESVMATNNCGTDGMSKFTCSVCGDFYTQVLPATGNHRYSNDCDTKCNVCYKTREVEDHPYVGVETKAPTCTETGVMTYTCSSCGDSYTEAIAALGHTAGAAADCENAQVCTVCGTELAAALGHSYKGVVTAPDCVNGGYTTYTCANCGDSYKADYTEASGHNYVGAQTKAPTCTETGVMTYTCSGCGDSYTEAIAALGHTAGAAADCENAQVCTVCGTELAAALGHSYKGVVTAPDCVNGGYTTYTCTACGDSYEGNHTTALGHTAGAAADCENAQTCTVCGEVLNAALGHTWVDASCDNPKYCSVCGETEGEALGHSYQLVSSSAPTCINSGADIYECSECGNRTSLTTPATNHPDRYFIEGFDSTCTALGELDHWYCPDCDCYWIDENFEEAYDETIIYVPMKSHVVPDKCTGICQGCNQYIEYLADHNTTRVEAVASTCTTQGNIMYRYCINCGMCWDKLGTEDPNDAIDPDSVYLPLADHSYNGVVTAPDCVNGGYTTYTCANCGDSYKADYTEASGHNYVGAQTKAPTCGETGVMTYTCSSCGDSYTEAIAATGAHEYFYPCDPVCMNCYEVTNPDAAHTIVYVEALAPTCTALGNIEYWYCSDCGAAWADEALTQVTNRFSVVVPATGEHSYDNAFDADCNVCGETRDMVAPMTFSGNSVSEDVSGLAFKFDLTIQGMEVINGYYAVYDNATINGYKLISMGAVVTNGLSTKDITAAKLCDMEGDAVSFAVRIINIPTDKYDVAITATPYVIVEIDGEQVTIYGEAQTASYNSVLNG